MMIIEIRPVVHVDSSLFADDWLETQEMEESRTPLLLAQANRIRVVREMGKSEFSAVLRSQSHRFTWDRHS